MNELSKPCECTNTEYPFFCPRYQREMHPEIHGICLGTFLPEQRDRYIGNWEKIRDQNAQPAETPARLELPCPHRGEQLRIAECSRCQGGPKPVFGCEIHGECVEMGNGRTRKEKIRECIKCPELPENVAEQPVPELSITMAVHDDYKGAWMTIMDPLMHHEMGLDDLHGVEFVVGDNNPDSKSGKLLRKLCLSTDRVRYVTIRDVQGSSLPKDRVIRHARGHAVLHLDSHVLLEAGVIARLKQHYRDNPWTTDLITGPLLHRPGQVNDTHQELRWRGGNLGVWARHEPARDRDGEPYEIPQHGTGLFSFRRECWLGYHPLFREYGGNETFLYEKWRRYGRKTVCLPWLRWLHCFGHPEGTGYSNTWADKCRNYLISLDCLGWERGEMIAHYNKAWGAPSKVEATVQAYEQEFPLVTAIMVTGLSSDRERFARRAIEDFLLQDWPRKELVIVNEGTPLDVHDHRVREIAADPALTLGQYLNIGLDNARGEWVCQWDDDDRHGPARILLQMKHRQKQTATLLGGQVRYNSTTDAAFVYTGPSDATALYFRGDHRYEAIQRGNDSRLLRQFKRVHRIENDPLMFVRQWHGGNMMGERHVMRGHQETSLSPEQTRELERILGHPLYDPTIKEWQTAAGGNESGAIPRRLWAAIASRIQPGQRTLEFGSGVSTWLFDRAGCNHLAIESVPMWRDRVARGLRHHATIEHRPLVSRGGHPPFYDWQPPGDVYDHLLIDGPAGEGAREGVLRVVDQIAGPQTVIYVDDMHRGGEAMLAEWIALRTRKQLTEHVDGKRKFGVLT